MNKSYRSFYILAVITLFITACSAQAVQAQPTSTVEYRVVLGKSLNDNEVKDFIATNHCVSATQFQLCKEAGMALWLDSNRMVKTVYLYLDNAEGFTPYKGELPFGLKFYDNLGGVEYKLKQQGVGNAGLPDEADTADHFHYWAIYKQAGMTIVYNEPYPDEDATTHAILVSSHCSILC